MVIPNRGRIDSRPQGPARALAGRSPHPRWHDDHRSIEGSAVTARLMEGTRLALRHRRWRRETGGRVRREHRHPPVSRDGARRRRSRLGHVREDEGQPLRDGRHRVACVSTADDDHDRRAGRGDHDLSPTRPWTGSCCSTRCRAHIDERAAFEAIAPARTSTASPCTPSPRWRSAEQASRRARRPASCACSTRTTSTSPASTRSSSAAARSSASRSACCCWPATRPSPSATRARATCPRWCAAADIVVAAVGKPNFVRGDWIKPGAVVIDAGYNAGNVGDVEFDGAARRVADHPRPRRRRPDDDRRAPRPDRRRRLRPV